MKITSLNIPEVLVLEPQKFGDDRGYFSEVFNQKQLIQAGADLDWVQDNHAMSRDAGTLRGLHFQLPPHAQSKLVRVVRGSIFDVAVDIRKGSPTYGEWVSATISAKAWNQILIPAGFAHGYLTLEPATEVLYKVDNYYAPDADKGLLWSDPDIAIDWPLTPTSPVLSDKDRNLPRLTNIASPFDYEA